MDALNLLPAILIGGPPHSGKSVLAYSLSQALRARKIAHYLLRAAPDGEGDWAQMMDPSSVHAIRFKGAWTAEWVRIVCRDLAARVMPLLVDIGGKPQEDQMVIFDQCTGAILLTPNDQEAAHWRRLVGSRGLPIIADLRSVLEGENKLQPAENGELRGTLSGLHRGRGVIGDHALDALAEHLASIFAFSEAELAKAHLAAAPTDARIVRFDEIAQRMYPHDAPAYFRAGDLHKILEAVPFGEPIAAYGRMPVWLATALGARRDLRWQFDARLGWVRTPRFVMCAPGVVPATEGGLAFRLTRIGASRMQLDVSKTAYYLDYTAMDGLRVPHIPTQMRVTINGSETPAGGLPLWVFAALGHAYRDCAGVEAHQAHQH
ncbi:MAG: hypothetical protein NZM18_00535 [Thermoflexales bacterium]|nr:hypothetical protein [Thermoflexales bacterium]MDW8352725.1 hypothetical protein [Anaerolineae bacterium]